MKTANILFLAIASLLGRSLIAQEQITIHKGCTFDGAETETEYYSFDPSEEASRIVHNILQAMGGLSDKSFTLKEANVNNAIATVENGQRFILYSIVFLEKFKGDAKSKWAAYTVMAHEIGHHLNNHDFAEKDPKTRKTMELEADKFAGAVCRTLGATLNETLAGMESMDLPGETSTHPTKSARIAAIANGWTKQDELLKNSNAKAAQVETDRETPKIEDAKLKAVKPQNESNLQVLSNGFIVGKYYCCNSNENLRYCIRSEIISQKELSQIKWQRDNDVYTEENDRTLIRCLQQGEQVQLIGEQGGWFRVYDPETQKTGFISKRMDGGIISLTHCN